MKDRMTLGHDADVAETAALTLADSNAERRMLDALDIVHVEQCEQAMEETEKAYIKTAVQRVRRALGDGCANVAYAYFNHKTWKEAGIPRRTFFHRLKKVKIFFHVHE